MFAGSISFFYNLFYALEDASLLDPANEKDIYSLHLCIHLSYSASIGYFL